MNQTPHPDSTADVPWLTSDRRAPEADHRAPHPDNGTTPSTAAGLLRDAEQGTHDTVDRLADGAATAARHAGQQLAAAEDALHEKADHWRELRTEWVEGARTSVRGKPLACVAAAFALGVVFARITR